MFDKLKDVESNFNKLEKLISNPNIINNPINVNISSNITMPLPQINLSQTLMMTIKDKISMVYLLFLRM